MSQPKGKKSNNQKKKDWFAFTSEATMLRQIRGIDLLSWFDAYKPEKASVIAAEQDILAFVNRECKAVRTEMNKSKK